MEYIRTEGEQTGLEGCLSLPGRWGVVTRPYTVRVRAQDRSGVTFEVEDEGLTARCFCHEIEHLDGHLFSEHCDRLLSDAELEQYLKEHEDEYERVTDHYDPRSRVLRLSETVGNVNSIAAVSVACHEAGHAIQHANGYAPLKIRNSIVPLANFASNFSWILVVIGIGLLGAGNYIGDTVFNIGIIMMIAVIFFHTITLPVEFNASSRALAQMEELAIIDDEEEAGAKKVLRAAALTYVAALAVAIGNLLRMLALRGRRD